MSDRSSDNEDAASDRSDSPEQEQEQEQSTVPEHKLPKNNPSNIPHDAEISDPRNAKRPTVKAKMFGRAPVRPPPADYAELQQQPNIDSRADGGFINPDNARPRDRRMTWDAAADRALMIFGFGRDINSKEYQVIADRFDQKPTTKAIQERITKLRVETRRALKETGIFDPERVANPPPPGGVPPRGPTAPGHGTSSPAPSPAKKKARPSSAKPKAKPPASPAGTGTPARASQPPQSQPPQAGQQGAPPHQSPSARPPPPPPTWDTRIPPGAPVATMSQPLAGSPQTPSSQIGVPPMGLPLYRPYGPVPPNLYGTPGGLGMGQYQHQQHQQLPAFIPGPYTPTLPSQQPAGAGTNPPVPSMGGSAEGEQEDPMVRSERELKEKKAKRDARKKSFQPPK